MLSFGNLRLRKSPSRTLSETIRWLSPEAAARCGVPDGQHAFEIVTVELFESEVYPQYASGSFNKTAGKWCLVSPAGGSCARARGGTRKLTRHCIYLPASWVVDGVTYDVDRARAFRPMPAGATVAQTFEYARRAIRGLQEGPVRSVYRLKEEMERARKLQLARPPGGAAAREGAAEEAEADEAMEAADRATTASPSYPPSHAHSSSSLDSQQAAAAGAAARAALEARVAACCYETSGRAAAVRTPQPSGHGTFSFLTPNPTTSPAHEPRAHSPLSSAGAPADEVARRARSPSPTRAHARASAADEGGGAVFGVPRRAPGAVCDLLARDESLSGLDQPSAPHSRAQGGLDQSTGRDSPGPRGDDAALRGRAPLHEQPSKLGARAHARGASAARPPLSRACGGGRAEPPRAQRFASDISLGSSAAAAVSALSLESGELLSVYPFAPGKGWFAFNRHGKSIFFLERIFRMLAAPRAQLRKHPTRTLGEVVRWLEPERVRARGRASGRVRCTRRRALPCRRAPLTHTPPHHRRSLATPRPPPAQAAALGAPAGVRAFEVCNTELFEDEVYPQFKSGSFRKTAKHWCILSQQPAAGSVPKLSVRCMFVPTERALDSAVAEPIDVQGCFRCGATAAPRARPRATRPRPGLRRAIRLRLAPLRSRSRALSRARRPVDPAWCDEEVERYIQQQIRPLEERVRGALLSTAAQRDRSAGARELLPPEKRMRRAEQPAREHAGVPALQHAHSCHL
jgi:hypothetical protein